MFAPQTVIGGRFQIESHLGTGGLGELYRALDQKTGKPVAIRILADEIAQSEAAVEQLREQVRLASSLNHKNAARVFGMGKEGSHRYIASEFINGQSLRHLIDRKRQTGKTFSLKGTYNVVAHVCNALEEAHQTMVHGLPGAGSILINRSGRVKLSDFGLVLALSPNSTPVERLKDHHALAPEMRMDPSAAGRAADIYSVGVMIHELLTGEPPTSPPTPMSQLVSGISPEIEIVVARCLQVDPVQRFAEAHDLKAAFYDAMQTSGAIGEAETRPEPQAQDAPLSAPGEHPSTPTLRPVATGPVEAPRAIAPSPQAQPARPMPQANQGSPLSGQLGPAPAPAGQALRIEDLLADTSGDNSENWLIQKDSLDFGPFALSDVKQQMYKGQFSGDDIIVDQETSERTPIRKHPLLVEFTQVLERHQQQQNAARNAVDAGLREKRRRAVLVTIITVSLILASGIGFSVWYFVLRTPPETKDRIVYRDRPGGKLSIKVAFNKEDSDQAKKRRAWKRRRHKRKKKGASSGTGSDVTYLGDATKAGGDALLTQHVIQQVMGKNINRLAACVQQQYRRQPSLRKVTIAFGVKGSGHVSYSKVNGQSSGPFQACIARKMHGIHFPKYDGAMTRASFTMTLGY
ncbi:MAG: protein kinase [Deltaproteobacteria bacterium]|nr:protein kinase [Deltaproteobacteria bacterium]